MPLDTGFWSEGRSIRSRQQAEGTGKSDVDYRTNRSRHDNCDIKRSQRIIIKSRCPLHLEISASRLPNVPVHVHEPPSCQAQTQARCDIIAVVDSGGRSLIASSAPPPLLLCSAPRRSLSVSHNASLTRRIPWLETGRKALYEPGEHTFLQRKPLRRT